ncbi:MAG: chromosome segregation protein SMC [Clostridiales bacterium]|jgi:chromosome segregation protein|nr:chromosome segregation protein SMC [Clostridiales bacterium]
MYLKTLEIQGFKSFPDKTTLRFGKGITSVVGPNGSGKSNISDAIRWVLGEQSSKSLRGARMEDVIFGGTSIRKALGFAEVTLRLDNSDRALEGCGSDEVSVSRRYYRSGESEYKVNGENVRLRDLHELFMDTGLGRDGYSIVGQGRVADLISPRSPQRREMLEEAAGIAAFRYRRLDATRKLQLAEDNLSRLRDILAELESRIGPLKAQSEKAQKFLVLAGEKKGLEIGLWLHAIEKAKSGIREQEHKLSIATAQYESADRELRENTEEYERIVAEGQSVTAEIEDTRRLTALSEEEAMRIDGDIAVEKNTIEHNSATIERITRDLEQAASDELQVDELISRAEKEIAELAALIDEQSKTLKEAADNILGLKDENAAFTERSLKLSQKLSELTMLLSEKRVEGTTASSSIDEIKTRNSNIDSVLSSRGIMLAEIKAERADCLSELDTLKESAAELTNFVTGHKLRVKNKREKADSLKDEIDGINLDAQQKFARAKMLEELEKNMEGYSGSVRAVIKESKRGNLRGIHGTISQLIKVEEKYAAAIETAFGASLQDIITDSENDAKRAIGFLKDSRSGRATFLPLTTVRHKPFSEKGLDGCAGFVAMADELITYDKKYDEIMKFELSRTAVADDLDSAIAIARKYGQRFKTVTLDGQVINAGGSMTGGSRARNSGLLSRVNETGKLKRQAEELAKAAEEKQAEHKSLTEELAAAEANLGGAEADLARAQESAIRKEGELKLVEGRLESVGAALQELNAEKDKNAVRISALEETVKKSELDIIGITGEIDAVQDELGELGRDREEIERRREELSKTESEINMRILSARKDIEAKQKSIESYEQMKHSNRDKSGELNDEIAKIAADSIETKEKIRQMEQSAQEIRTLIARRREEVSLLSGRRAQLEKLTSEMRRKERSVSDVKESLSGELARLGERRAAMENELETSKAKLYDEYDLTLHEAEEMEIEISDYPKAQRELAEIRNKIRALGTVNVGAVEEYKEISLRYEFLSGQINDAERSKEELTKLIGDLTGKMAERFREQFGRINAFFSETFSELFDGGKAELVLENQLDVLECNIDIKVQPPGKNVQNIDLLSGGEKGLSAIALLFAILKVSPAPFCVFDEVEAALDDVNVTRYAKYVRLMTKNTQFIIITHRRGTMEEADILYGVTMQEEGVSKLLELKTAEMAKRLGID